MALYVATAAIEIAAAGSAPAPASAQAASSPTPQAIEFFESRIRPVLIAACGECHIDDDQGSLLLDSRESMLKGGESGPVIVPVSPTWPPLSA